MTRFFFLWGSRSKKDMRGYAGGHQNCPSINLSTVQEDPQVTWVLIDDNWKKNLFLKTFSSHVLFLDECNEFLTSFFSFIHMLVFEYQVMGWPVRTKFFFNSSIFLAFHLFHFSAAAQDPKGAPDIYDPLKCTGLVEFYSIQFTYIYKMIMFLTIAPGN